MHPLWMKLSLAQQTAMIRAKHTWTHARDLTWHRGPNVRTIRFLVDMGYLESMPCAEEYPYFMVRLRAAPP